MLLTWHGLNVGIRTCEQLIAYCVPPSASDMSHQLVFPLRQLFLFRCRSYSSHSLLEINLSITTSNASRMFRLAALDVPILRSGPK